MEVAKTGFAASCRLASTAAAKAWPKVRMLLVVAVALSMAEFVAVDIGLLVAADLILYVELMLSAWAIALVARILPGVSTSLILLSARLYHLGSPAESNDRAEAGRLEGNRAASLEAGDRG
jgi:uncharacterized membrane protein